MLHVIVCLRNRIRENERERVRTREKKKERKMMTPAEESREGKTVSEAKVIVTHFTVHNYLYSDIHSPGRIILRSRSPLSYSPQTICPMDMTTRPLKLPRGWGMKRVKGGVKT